MKKLILITLCVALVNAKWSIHSEGRHHDETDLDHNDLDWWEHGVFYQVRYFEVFQCAVLCKSFSVDLSTILQR